MKYLKFSWANRVLSLVGYDRNPAKLQSIIRRVFEEATRKIAIPGSEVIPVPMFETLDGSDTSDYEERVEPSVGGGMKLAKTFLRIIEAT